MGLGWIAVALAVLVLVAAALTGYWICQKRKERRCYEAGIQRARQGDRRGALELLAQAETAWMLNLNQQSPASYVQDLDRLAAIACAADECVRAEESLREARELRAVIELHKVLLANRDNFGIDGRTMKPSAAREWARLQGQLKEIRVRFRQALGSLLAVRQN